MQGTEVATREEGAVVVVEEAAMEVVASEGVALTLAWQVREEALHPEFDAASEMAFDAASEMAHKAALPAAFQAACEGLVDKRATSVTAMEVQRVEEQRTKVVVGMLGTLTAGCEVGAPQRLMTAIALRGVLTGICG